MLCVQWAELGIVLTLITTILIKVSLSLPPPPFPFFSFPSFFLTETSTAYWRWQHNRKLRRWSPLGCTLRQCLSVLYNHSEPMPGKVMHIAIDQNADLPFTDYKIEEVVSYSGESINAVSSGLYYQGKLLLGTIRKDMWMCDVPYLMYWPSLLLV